VFCIVCPPHQLSHTFEYSIHYNHRRIISVPTAVNIAHTNTELVVGGGRKRDTWQPYEPPASQRTVAGPKTTVDITCVIQLFTHRLDRPRLLYLFNNELTKLVNVSVDFWKPNDFVYSLEYYVACKHLLSEYFFPACQIFGTTVAGLSLLTTLALPEQFWYCLVTKDDVFSLYCYWTKTGTPYF